MRSGIVFTASFPVALVSGGEPQLEAEVVGPAAKGIRAAFVDGVQGTLRLETTNWGFVAASHLATLLAVIGLAYVFYLLRGVLQAIIHGDPFTQANVVRIRKIGYLVLLLGLLYPTVEYIAAQEVLGRLAIVEPELSLPSLFDVDVILTSLLILILAQVWSYGLELERDRALTI